MILRAVVLTAAMLFQQAAQAPPVGVLAGNVKYADGTPFAKAILFAQPLSETGRPPENSFRLGASTSETGDFRIRNLPPGRYAIRTIDSAAYFPGVTTLGAATILTVTAGSVTENLNFILPAALTGYRVSGRVIRPPSQPKAATEVSSSSGTQYISGPVADDGTFELRHVRSGTYSFQVSPAIGMRPVSIVVDRDIAGLELAMPKLFDIAGTVTIEGRANSSGLFEAGRGTASTMIFDGPIRPVAGIQPDGTFKVTVPEGEYRLHVDRLSAGYYIKTLTAGQRDLFSNRLQVGGSDEPVQIAMTLAVSAGVKVTGKVTGMNRGATTLAFLGAVSTNGYESAVQPDGSFALSQVMPGGYVARVMSSSPLASPPISVVIPNRNVADLEIAVPPPVNVSGRVTVDGNGPPPKFTMILVHGSVSNWSSTPDNDGIATLQQEARTGGVQLIKVDVDALPDGSFKLQLPEGEYRVAAQRTSIPSPYVLTSISYAGVNLLVDPLSISEKESSEIQVGFGTTSPNPWSKVSGRVIGQDPGQGPFRVVLEGSKTSSTEAIVNADGTFEFARILQNGAYTARLRPENAAASSPSVSVGTKDVDNIEITVPHEREVTVRTAVEGSGPVPSYVLSLLGNSSTVSALVKPDSSGRFRLKLPEDERQVSFDSLPLGYIVKSVMFGLTDLRACVQGAPPRCSFPPLKIAGSTATDLEVTFAQDPAIPFGKISGRVTGLNSESTDVRLVLSDATTFSTFEQTIGAGGVFDFSSLPQGPYVPSLAGSKPGQSGLLDPSLINVTGMDTSGIEIVVPKGNSEQDRPPAVTDAAVGARVSEFGGSSRSAAMEAAAVATLRTINTAEVTFLSVSKGNFGTISQMIDVGLLPENFRGAVNGFNYGVISSGSDFVGAAIPNASGSGRYGFYVTPDGTVRYSTIEQLAPAGQNGAPVH